MNRLHIVMAIVLTFMVGLLVYSAHVIQQARAHTDQVILPDLARGHWRSLQGEARALSVRADGMNPKHRDWLLQIEDPAFYAHDGIDLVSPGAGYTTITQGLVKRLYFESFKPGWAKYKQSLIARFVVSDLITKDAQLNLFLNSAYLGHSEGQPIYGFERAAQAYFGKSYSGLSDDDFLALVAMLVGPNRYHVIKSPEMNQERVSRIKAVISGAYVPTELSDVLYNRS